MTASRENLICAILAGGRSLRMGRPKALITLGGKPLIARIAEQARTVTEEVYVCGRVAPEVESLGLPVIPDVYEGRGPLAGLHAALFLRPSLSVLLLACDLPNVHSAMLGRLVELAEGFDIAAACTSAGIPQPLCAVYRHTCRDTVEECLEKDTGRVMDLIAHPLLRVHLVGPKEGNFTDFDLANLNTPEDLERMRESGGNIYI